MLTYIKCFKLCCPSSLPSSHSSIRFQGISWYHYGSELFWKQYRYRESLSFKLDPVFHIFILPLHSQQSWAVRYSEQILHSIYFYGFNTNKQVLGWPIFTPNCSNDSEKVIIYCILCLSSVTNSSSKCIEAKSEEAIKQNGNTKVNPGMNLLSFQTLQ